MKSYNFQNLNPDELKKAREVLENSQDVRHFGSSNNHYISTQSLIRREYFDAYDLDGSMNSYSIEEDITIKDNSIEIVPKIPDFCCRDIKDELENRSIRKRLEESLEISAVREDN